MANDREVQVGILRRKSCPNLESRHLPTAGDKSREMLNNDLFHRACGRHDCQWRTENEPKVPTANEQAKVFGYPTPPSPALEHLKAVEFALSRRTLQANLVNTYGMPASAPRETLKVENHVRDQSYILRVCRALMSCGAPTHRLEQYMHSSAEALGVNLDSFYLPGCMIISFPESSEKRSEVHIIRCTEALNLAKLSEVHATYKAVIHKSLDTGEAVRQLDEISSRSNKYPRWLRVLLFGLTSLCFGPVSYGARPVDLPVIFLLGSLVGWLQLVVAPKSELYGYVFEMTAAILVSCVGRAFGTISWGPNSGFCFSAISQASIVLLLPGFTITSSALELQSKNIVSGAVRMVYAIIYTLFLAFGFTVGTTIYGAIDSNATSSYVCQDEWPFWWQVPFVLPFTVCFVLLNEGRWTRMPPTIIITYAGWVVNHFCAQRFESTIQFPQALGALTVGLLANLHSRLRHGLAVAMMHPAIYIQVPGSFAASGSFISGLTTADQLNHRAKNLSSVASGDSTAQGTQSGSPMLDAGVSMIEIAVSITVGLSVSALLVYPFRKRSGKSGLFSF